MNILTIIIGLLCTVYGVFTAVLRVKMPEKFEKMAVMQNRFGEKKGKIIYIVFYSFLPAAAGIIFIISGFMGRGLLQQ